MWHELNEDLTNFDQNQEDIKPKHKKEPNTDQASRYLEVKEKIPYMMNIPKPDQAKLDLAALTSMSGARKDVVFQVSPTLSFYDSLTHKKDTSKDLPPVLTSSLNKMASLSPSSIVNRHGELYSKGKKNPETLSKIRE
jgi:hypothetical protein